MRKRICKRCGQEFIKENKSQAYLCPQCATEARRESVYKERTCKICGEKFMGYPRSFFCPSCREERKRQQKKIYNQRNPLRPIGSTDICISCKKPYIVNSGAQRYCPDCAKTKVPDNIKKHKIKYMAANKDKKEQLKKDTCGKRYVCIICGKEFQKNTPTVTCSKECEKELKRLRQAESDIRRGRRFLPADQKYDSGLPKSGVVGITWHRQNEKWQVSYKDKYIGIYKTLEEAKQALEDYRQKNKE